MNTKELKDFIEELYNQNKFSYKTRDEIMEKLNQPISEEERRDSQVYDSLIQDGY